MLLILQMCYQGYQLFADDTNSFLSTRDIDVLSLDCNNSNNSLNKWFVQVCCELFAR